MARGLWYMPGNVRNEVVGFPFAKNQAILQRDHISGFVGWKPLEKCCVLCALRGSESEAHQPFMVVHWHI